jgi:hypothetical protein
MGSGLPACPIGGGKFWDKLLDLAIIKIGGISTRGGLVAFSFGRPGCFCPLAV